MANGYNPHKYVSAPRQERQMWDRSDWGREMGRRRMQVGQRGEFGRILGDYLLSILGQGYADQSQDEDWTGFDF